MIWGYHYFSKHPNGGKTKISKTMCNFITLIHSNMLAFWPRMPVTNRIITDISSRGSNRSFFHGYWVGGRSEQPANKCKNQTCQSESRLKLVRLLEQYSRVNLDHILEVPKMKHDLVSSWFSRLLLAKWHFCYIYDGSIPPPSSQSPPQLLHF